MLKHTTECRFQNPLAFTQMKVPVSFGKWILQCRKPTTHPTSVVGLLSLLVLVDLKAGGGASELLYAIYSCLKHPQAFEYWSH